MAQAIPEILYFRCPMCAKRFPGTAFADQPSAECQACGVEVDSPYFPQRTETTESPADLEGDRMGGPVELEAEDAAESLLDQDASGKVAAEQLLTAFRDLSLQDQQWFLDETLAEIEPELPGHFSNGTQLRVALLIALLTLGTILLNLLYVESKPDPTQATASASDVGQ